MSKKYELTGETQNFYGTTLYRIKAVRDFSYVKVGDLGGWIESELNLSHEGDCWVFGNAKVYGNSLVYGNAKVYGNSWVFGNAKVYEENKALLNALVGERGEE